MRSIVHRDLLVCVVAAVLCTSASSQAARDKPPFISIVPGDVHWEDISGGHGAQHATLFGDTGKAGMYVVRVKFPPYVMDAPHWHPNDRFVTVLQGTWYAGTGETFDVARAVPLKPGSFMMHPARAAHWDGSAGNETVIVQIIGVGPTEGGQVHAGMPEWLDIPH